MIKKRVFSYGLIVLLFTLFVTEALFFEPHDFSNYYFGALFLDQGRFDPVIYNPTWFNLQIAQLQDSVFAAYAPNTPFLALFFIPFTWIDFELAKFLFNLISAILLIASIIRLNRLLRIKPIYIIASVAILFIPFRNNFLFGQVYALLFTLLVEGFISYRSGNYFKMSLLWGVAILLKIFPVVLIAFLVAKKKWKATSILVLTTVTILLLAISVNGLESWTFFFREIMPRASQGEISLEYVSNYQSIQMFLKHAFVASIENSLLIQDHETSYKSLLLWSKICLILIAIWATLKSKNELQAFSVWIFIFYLLSPYSSTYGSILLLVPMLLVVQERKKVKITMFAIGILIYGSLPAHSFESSSIAVNYLRLFILLILFTCFIWKLMPSYKLSFPTLSTSLFIIYTYFSLSEKTSHLYQIEAISSHQIAFLNNFHIKDQRIYYEYWNQNGKQKDYLLIEDLDVNIAFAKAIPQEDLMEIFGEHRHYGNFKNVIQVNNKDFLLLSDMNRGYGFNRLFKLSHDD